MDSSNSIKFGNRKYNYNLTSAHNNGNSAINTFTNKNRCYSNNITPTRASVTITVITTGVKKSAITTIITTTATTSQTQ